MNSLSWFLYFAGIAQDIKFLLAVVIGLFVLVVVVIYYVHQTEYYDPPFHKGWFAIFPLCWFLSVAIPDKNTLYAIAASEMGEKIVESELGKKAQAAIEAWIDSQITKKESK